MDGGKQHVDERAPGEQRMEQTERHAEQPARATDREEHGVVHERERQPGYEMEAIAEHLGHGAVVGKGRPQQERDVHAREAELTGAAQRGGQDERASEASSQRRPDAHDTGAAMAAAALMMARCTSPWGKLPRKSPLVGSSSSEKSPTSFARASAASIARAASSRRPASARASASQNEQHTKTPSTPASPSSPV